MERFEGRVSDKQVTSIVSNDITVTADSWLRKETLEGEKQGRNYNLCNRVKEIRTELHNTVGS
jgi:hypothetical protein